MSYLLCLLSLLSWASGASVATSLSPPSLSNVSSAEELIERSLGALGGEKVLNTVKGITYRSPSVYRTQTLMQNYDLIKADQFVSIEGHQNISFSFGGTALEQRIDRHFVPSDYWIWGKGNLDPIDYSLVVKSGENGFACYVRGNNLIYMEPTYTAGYTDAALAEYLVQLETMMSPLLMTMIKSNNAASSSLVQLRKGIQLPAVTDAKLNLTVVFDPTTGLPHVIRSYQTHPVYGPCTYDLQVSNYTIVDGVKIPRRFQSVYDNELGSDAVLEDFLVEHIDMNPEFDSDFFTGLPANESDAPKVAPKADPDLSHAEILEGFSNMIWGFDTEPLGNLSATRFLSNVPKLWNVMFENSAYSQLVMEFEDGVIVADAPEHQSSQVIEWIQENINKPITHVWPSHHHRDHAGEAAKYVKLGAKLIIPEMATRYWSSIPGAEFVIFTEERPYVHKDRNMQAWFMWREEAVHASDWSYMMVTSTCPDKNDGVAVFNADAWSPGTDAIQFDIGFARQWLDQMLYDGLSKSALVVPAHGIPTPLTELLEITAYMYPNLTTHDWRNGALECRL
ncbi:metallo-beta-lactamase superfamily protein [Rhizodiscina lignyota]|uniref:Metallo-beta-lactamase superfamily protein n=1 Tax=Rhizodiscina lignyota TaxID=1504668 RepID=A0A9P4I5F1_9PEZI|nr:metallo-beta-lactamase superfamily protein [Rhizodiscina lignyota]